MAAPPPPPTVVNGLDFADVVLDRLADDLARGIWDEATICARYEIEPAQLAQLRDNRAFARMERDKRAIWESDGNAAERLRAYWVEGMIQAAPSTISMLQSPTVSHASKIELTKLGAKIAGVDTAPAKEGGSGGGQGSQFAVNIILGGQVSSIQTSALPSPALVIDGEAA